MGHGVLNDSYENLSNIETEIIKMPAPILPGFTFLYSKEIIAPSPRFLDSTVSLLLFNRKP